VFIVETGVSMKMARLYGRSPRVRAVRIDAHGQWKTATFVGEQRQWCSTAHGWPGISHGIELPTPQRRASWEAVNSRSLPASPAAPKALAVEFDSGPIVSPAAGISGTRGRYAALRSLRLAAEVAGSCTVM
jgi:hypothetical protein